MASSSSSSKKRKHVHSVTVSEADTPSPPVPNEATPSAQNGPRPMDSLRIHSGGGGGGTATETLNKHRHSMRTQKLQIDEEALFGKHSPQFAAKRTSSRSSGNSLGPSVHAAAPRTSRQFDPQSLRFKRSSQNLEAAALPQITTVNATATVNGHRHHKSKGVANGAMSGSAGPSGGAAMADDAGSGSKSGSGSSPSGDGDGDDDDSRCIVM